MLDESARKNARTWRGSPRRASAHLQRARRCRRDRSTASRRQRTPPAAAPSPAPAPPAPAAPPRPLCAAPLSSAAAAAAVQRGAGAKAVLPLRLRARLPRPRQGPSRRRGAVAAAGLRLAAPGDDRVHVGGADAGLDDRDLDDHPGAARRPANADKTPNPSKAPWYFLNLQELLLHMHPALAGVLIPSGALALIAIIPYFDRDNGRRQVVRDAEGGGDHLVLHLVHDDLAVRPGAVRRVHRRQADDEQPGEALTAHLRSSTWPSWST